MSHRPSKCMLDMHTVVSSRGSGRERLQFGKFPLELTMQLFFLTLGPTLGILSLHAPTGGTGGETSMEEALAEIGTQMSHWSLRYQTSSGRLEGTLIASSLAYRGSLVLGLRVNVLGMQMKLVCITLSLLPGT